MKKILFSLVLAAALALTACGSAAVPDVEGTPTTGPNTGPALVNTDGWHLVGYSMFPAGTNYQSTAPEGSCWPTNLITLNNGEKADWDFSTCSWKKSTMDVITVAPTAVPPTMAAPTQPAPSSQVLTCSDGRTVPVPLNGQLFPANDGKVNYSVIYDPSQSGAMDLPPLGWWYQPCLPGLSKDAHSVPTILQTGYYRYIGPECTVYFNDGNHPNKWGTVLVDHANDPNLYVPATEGHGTEAWIFVSCDASDSSGFSFALK